jgi:hypothetical protein
MVRVLSLWTVAVALWSDVFAKHQRLACVTHICLWPPQFAAARNVSMPCAQALRSVVVYRCEPRVCCGLLAGCGSLLCSLLFADSGCGWVCQWMFRGGMVLALRALAHATGGACLHRHLSILFALCGNLASCKPFVASGALPSFFAQLDGMCEHQHLLCLTR